MKKPHFTRRTLLSALGTCLPLTTRRVAAQTGPREGGRYSIAQGDQCESISPISGRLPVESYYDYQLPEKYVSDENGASVGSNARYASAGTQELQRPRTSIMFLYDGPKGLSLVIVHGARTASEGGSVTFRLTGLPADGRWVVKDDFYRDPTTGNIAASNFDRWHVNGTEHRIDWTWGSGGTDGGVFRDLGDGFEVVIRPAFNADATLYDDHYEGEIANWEFLSGSVGVSKRIPLGLDQPVRIHSGSC